MKTIYLISGPLGVGKTTVSTELAKILNGAPLVEGDLFFNATEESHLSWEERLQDAWQKILALAKAYLQNNANVVIDFVVEDELSWFYQQFPAVEVTIKYVVLVTDEAHIVERLQKRDELQYKDRSLFLLNKLAKGPANTPYLYNTTGKDVTVIAQDIVASDLTYSESSL